MIIFLIDFQVYQGIFIKILGISVLLDPIVYDWLAYFPKQLFSSVEENIMLDAEVVLATDPLNSSCFGRLFNLLALF